MRLKKNILINIENYVFFDNVEYFIVAVDQLLPYVSNPSFKIFIYEFLFMKSNGFP